MQISEQEIKELRSLKTLMDSDNIRHKETIKKHLLENNKIIYLLNNKELVESGAEADEYYGVNILPYYLIHPTQTDVQNFICFDVGFDEVDRYNRIIKYLQINFYILCDQKNIIEKNTYIARHDLLAALILDEFNHTNYFGTQIHCVSDEASVVDSDYSCRTLIFQQETPSNIAKTKNLQTRVVNTEVTA